MPDRSKPSKPRSPSPRSSANRSSAPLTASEVTPECPGDRRSECQAERRAAVIAAAVHKIATLGLEGLRVRDVASETGINHATLLYYFPTKEDLIQAVVDNVTTRFDEFRARAAISFDDSAFEANTANNATPSGLKPIELLRAYFLDVCRFMQRDPAAFIVLNELLLRALRDPMVRRTLEAYEATWRSALARVLEVGVTDGSFRKDLDIPGTVTHIIVFLRGLSLEVDETSHWLEHTVSVFTNAIETLVTPS